MMGDGLALAEPLVWRCENWPAFCGGMAPGWKPGKFCCCGVSERDVGSMPGFCRGEPEMESSRGRGRFDGMTELVW